MELTEKHFKIFREECGRWVKHFKLDNWDIHYRWQDDMDNRASLRSDLRGYMATFFLSREWDNCEGMSAKDIEEEVGHVAKHEAIHLLLVRLSTNAKVRYVQECDLEESEEELVTKLEKLL